MGASSGIGYRVAEEFAKRGVKLGLAARNTNPLRDLKAKYPDLVEYASINVNDIDAPIVMRELIGKMGGMDIYFHAAGIGYDNPTLEPSREVDILNTNACGFARMISTAYDYFRQTGVKGRIAAITSVAGTNGIGGMSAYSASKKCAQTYLTALEQRSREEGVSIRFTDIRPGWIRTPLLHEGETYPLEMKLDYAVRLIIRAIVKSPRVAVVDWRWNLLVGLWRCIPNCIWVRMKASKFT